MVPPLESPAKRLRRRAPYLRVWSVVTMAGSAYWDHVGPMVWPRGDLDDECRETECVNGQRSDHRWNSDQVQGHMPLVPAS